MRKTLKGYDVHDLVCLLLVTLAVATMFARLALQWLVPTW